MTGIQIVAEEIELDSPTLVEGLPGAGLVGKIAADHLVQLYDMEYYAGFHCEGLPRVAIYEGEGSSIRPPVRLYADEARDLVVLQSDVPVSPTQASEFVSTVTTWIDETGAFPLYLSGLADDKDGSPELYGVSTGACESVLDEEGIVPPRAGGMISGPTGALLHRAIETDLDAIGLIVQTEPQFPDPEAARTLLEHGVGPIAGVDIDTDRLVEQADEIQQAREQLAAQLTELDSDERTQAQPIRGFH